MVLLFQGIAPPSQFLATIAIAKGTKSQVTTSPLPSRGPTSGWNCYITPVFLGAPNKGDKIINGYITPALEK